MPKICLYNLDMERVGGNDLIGKALDIIRPGLGVRVLDMGCGDGASLAFIHDRYAADCDGVDIYAPVIEKASTLYPEIRFTRTDIRSLPFESGIFDLVIAECVLVLLDDPKSALDEAFRVLKDGGHLIVTSPVLKGAEMSGPLPGASDIRGMLEQSGFLIISESDESKALIRFVAEAVFEYGSVEAMMASCGDEGCRIFPEGIEKIPGKDIGYVLLIAVKQTDDKRQSYFNTETIR